MSYSYNEMEKMATRIKKSILKKTDSTKEPTIVKGLSSGCTVINMACTGKPNIAFEMGKYYFLVGDSISGKTFLSINSFAEACINPLFENHRLIYDNSEDGCLMDIAKLFGKETARRIEPPRKNKSGEGIYSEMIEDFYYNLSDALDDGRPFIYILDSMDALSSLAEDEKFEQQKDAHRKGKTTTGSYGDGKAKKNSSNIRRIVSKLRNTKSILIIIGQTRDNMGTGFAEKTRSGGKALRFYATAEIWTSNTGDVKKTYKGKPRSIGTHVLAKVKKNRHTGLRQSVKFDIYPSYGLDDIGSCVDYLLDEKYWNKKGTNIDATELKFSGSRYQLIKFVEDNNKEILLRKIVAKCWRDIQKACSVDRKGRYS